MRSRCTAVSDSARLLLTATIRLPAHSTWNSSCKSPANSATISATNFEKDLSMKKAILFAFMTLTAVYTLAIDSKTVSYKSGDETVQGVLYTPAGKGPFPAIIVIHEWWGLNDWVKEQASKLADEGYIALAVD